MRRHALYSLVLLGILAVGARSAHAAPPSEGVDTSRVQIGDPARRLDDLILYKADPRHDEVRFDADSGMVGLARALDNQELGLGTRMTLREYSRYLTLKSYGDLLHRRVYSDLAAPGDPGLVTSLVPGKFRVELPNIIPGKLQGLLGSARPNLALTGRETLTLGGTSNWDDRPRASGRQSKFPQLEMKQDLQVRVQGNIGIKVKVDVDQSSNAAQTSLANRIRIQYQGDEDEVVRRFELGNTNLSLPGTQFVSYSGQHQGLFGLKSENRFGPLDFTVIASKQEGQSKRDSFKRTAQQRTERIEDYSFVQRTFFYLNLQDEDVDLQTVRLYINLRQGGAQTDSRDGYARKDPDHPDPQDASGFFVFKNTSDFYEVHTSDWPVCNEKRPVIELFQQLDPSWDLAVAYKLKDGRKIGDDTGDTLQLKMIRPHKDLLSTNSGGDYEVKIGRASCRERV